MASTKVSPETQAIIDKLTSEGELIRNRGVNSVRTLSVKLEKFDGLFSSIQNNMKEQTILLEQQAGLNERAETRLKNQEQFDELERDKAQPAVDTGENRGRDDTKINKMGDAIGKAFTMQSLKNVAMVAGGAFIGYNLIKGAIDEKTGGGFSAMESNIGKFARGLGDLDMDEIRANFNTLTESISGIAASLTSLTAVIEKITSIDWETIVSGVLKSIGLLTAYNLTMKAAIMLMGANSLFGGKARFFKALLGAGVGVATLNSLVDTDADRQKITDADANNRNRLSANQRAALSGTGAYAVEPAAPRVVTDAPKQPNFNYDPDSDIYRSNNTGRVLAGTARTAAENARLRAMQLPELNMPDRTPSGAFEIPKISPPSARQIADDFMKANKTQIAAKAVRKVPGAIAKSFPVVGTLLGLGFMVWSISKGDFTSAALEGGSLAAPSMSGIPLDMFAVGTSIFFEITGENYTPTEANNLIMVDIMGMIYDAYIKYLEDKDSERRRAFDALPESERAAITAEQEYLAGGGRPGGRLGERGNTSIGSMSLGSYSGPDNTLNQSPAFKGNYFQGQDGSLYFQASPQNGGGMATRIGRVSELGATPPVVMIDSSQNNPVTVNTMQGAQSHNDLTVVGSSGSGRDAAFTQNFLPYFSN